MKNINRKTMLEVRGCPKNALLENQRPLTRLGQRCKRSMVGAPGVEPGASCTPCKRASRTALRPDLPGRRGEFYCKGRELSTFVPLDFMAFSRMGIYRE